MTVAVGKRTIAGCPMRGFPFFFICKTFLEPCSSPLCLVLLWKMGTFSMIDGIYMFFHSDGIPKHLPSTLIALLRSVLYKI